MEQLGEGRKGMALKPEYQDLYDEWEITAKDSGCTCFINPPCSYCTHEGNPINLNECDDVWEHELIAAVRREVEKNGS